MAAELLDGGAMEMVEGTRIVELLLAMPPADTQAPVDSLREVPTIVPLPFSMRVFSRQAM